MIARELAIQGPVDKWEEAEMLVREEVKKNGKTGAAKKIERSSKVRGKVCVNFLY